MKVRDVMTTNVVSVAPDDIVSEVASLLLNHRISAVFVIDDAGLPIGIVSEGDLMRRVETDTERTRPWWLRLFSNPDMSAGEYAKSHGRRAQDVMTQPVISIGGGVSLREAATLLERNGIKRMPVVEDGIMVGVVSRANLLRGLATGSAYAAETQGRERDRAIRDNLLAELSRQSWSSANSRNVIVEDGVVHLWGLVASEDERRATRIAAEGVPNVRAVEDHLIVRPLVGMDA